MSVLKDILKIAIDVNQDGTTDFDKSEMLNSIKLALSTHVSFNVEEINPKTIQVCKNIISGFKNPLQKMEFDMNIPQGYANNEQVSLLADLNNHIKNNTFNNSPLWTKLFGEKTNLSGDDGIKWSFKQVLNANTRMNGIIDKINNHTINGKPLTPYEKFLAAYSWITSFPYKLETQNPDKPNFKNKIYKQINGVYKKLSAKPNMDALLSRDPMRILENEKRNPLKPKKNDFIVCVGYASILKRICDGIGITCFEQSCDVFREKENKTTKHLTCLLNLQDPEYDINGIFFSDPSADSRKKDKETSRYCFHAVTYERLRTQIDASIKNLDLQTILDGNERPQPEYCYSPDLLDYLESFKREDLRKLSEPNEIQLLPIQKALYKALTCDLGQANNLHNVDRALYNSIITGMRTFGIKKNVTIDDTIKSSVILEINKNRHLNPIAQQQNKSLKSVQ